MVVAVALMNGALHQRKPDFERLRTVLLRRGEPDCVPLFGFSVADQVMSGFLGRAVGGTRRIGTAHDATGREWAAEHECKTFFERRDRGRK